MTKIKETSEHARQGEITNKRPILKVLVISTIVAALVLLIASELII